MLDGIVSRIKEATLVCGIGTPHVGSVGLRTTTAEAKAALSAARAAGRANEAVPYDQVGLERTLIEWYASDASRQAVDSLLAPLDKLKPQKRDQSIQTLKSYLDHQGSLSKTAEELHLHRNAVAYRVDRIFASLGLDREDPDTRLLLQLACRARSLS
jgi:DNA-binding PucR family transcriptional regulator